MRRIVIYNASWSIFGGGEKYICAVADALTLLPDCEVTLLIDTPDVTREQLQRYFRLALDNVRIKRTSGHGVHAAIADADLGIIVSNFKPFGTPSRKTIYVLQIPYAEISTRTIIARALRAEIREALKDIGRKLLLRDARRADAVLVYSRFVQEQLQHHHRISSEVLYPPIDDFSLAVQKENVILSVGRFFTGLYNDKRYDVMIEAFKKLCGQLPNTSWQYWLVGSCGTDNDSRRYLDRLREAARGYQIYFRVNSSYDDLRRYYNQATLFWHATGFGVDEKLFPERMEHFGMSTVEAMSASCIPIVIGKGGQKEIVSHGESGYLWSTLDELVSYSRTLIEDPGLVQSLCYRVRSRFTNFTHERFSQRLHSIFSQLYYSDHDKIDDPPPPEEAGS
jgi:glycosyltransferase involved in cell wall biosynthesis